MAVVPDPLWEEDGGLLWNDCKLLLLMPSNVRKSCRFVDCNTCFSAVGHTLHDSDRLHQEQPDRLLLVVGGCWCQCGGGVPPAVVGLALWKLAFVENPVTLCTF